MLRSVLSFGSGLAGSVLHTVAGVTSRASSLPATLASTGMLRPSALTHVPSPPMAIASSAARVTAAPLVSAVVTASRASTAVPAIIGVARAVDFIAASKPIAIDNTHRVAGRDAKAYADRLMTRRALISPMAVGVHESNGVPTGHVFPGGPEVGFEVLEREDTTLPDGGSQSTLTVRYSGELRGPGRITVTEKPGGGLTVRDEWFGVENHSVFPSRLIEAAHGPIVAGGFQAIADENGA